MADEQYQEGWSQDRVALPDTSSNWSITKALQDYANPTAPAWTPENSSLNLLLDKPTMADIDWTGEHDPADMGAAYSPDANSSARPGWMQLPQPGTLEAGEHGSGYYTYGTDPSGRAGTGPNYQWGEPRTMEVIGSVADKLATGSQFTPFGVGNISLPDGAKSADHQGHQLGGEIDVRPARIDGTQTGVTYKDSQYDRAATQRLIEAFRATGQVGTILFNDPVLISKGLVQPARKHDDHFHVRLKE
jgi:penicillin-insensitive murein endopeptidase